MNTYIPKIAEKIVFILLLLVTSIVYSQEFKYKEVPKSIIDKYYSHIEYKAKNEDVYALKYLPKKVKKDGSVDYTKYLQKAIDENQRVIIPNFSIAINKDGLTIPSNRTIIFQRNSVILYKGIAKGKLDDIIKIYNVKNVKLINPKVIGNKKDKSQKGEWNAGISILNSENINIDNALIKDTWGDGIFIGSEDNGVSKNINLNKIWIDNVRRNAISITSLIKGNINNVLLSNTNGTLPECGVDIEPSLFGEFIQDVKFNNLYSYNNKNAAFNVNLTMFNSDIKQYKDEVSITVKNIFDEYSKGYIGLNLNNFNKKFTPYGVINIESGNTTNPKHNITLDTSKVKTNIKIKNEGLKKKN